MTFRSVPFNQFKTGTASFTCRLECAFSYNNKKSDWKTLHDQAKWRELALAVMDVGYLSDLSYFMLAEAAKGLALNDAAKTHDQRGFDTGREYGCAGAFNSCEGYDVPTLISREDSNRAWPS